MYCNLECEKARRLGEQMTTEQSLFVQGPAKLRNGDEVRILEVDEDCRLGVPAIVLRFESGRIGTRHASGQCSICTQAPLDVMPNNIQEPKRVPWTMEDVPWLCWIRHVGSLHRHLCTEVGRNGVWSGLDSIPYNDLAIAYEYSTDGVTWLPCSKEEHVQ